jgi:16S rRNA (cytidine1402-2'-O)-methyltransferase
MGTLYVIATPIGNLEDVTTRSLTTLASLDLLLCEDTRVTGRLLSRYETTVKMEPYREDLHFKSLPRIVEMLQAGKTIGLVSDAGTPGIADPGYRLVRDVLAAAPDTKVIPIPGPSAVAAALSASGMPSDQYVFMGFPPHKKGRTAMFKEAMAMERTTVMYESTHRITKALEAIAAIDPNRQLVVGREITKLHETFYRGTASEVMAKLDETSSKGEFVIIIEGADGRGASPRR